MESGASRRYALAAGVLLLLLPGCSGRHSISGTVSGAVADGVGIAVDKTAGATTSGGGHYAISDLDDGDYTLTPSSAGYTFEPASLVVKVHGGDVTGQNFGATALGGTLDVSFGSAGEVTTSFGSGGSSAYAVAVQADRKIVAAGRGGGAALARYDERGALDPGFGTAGQVTTAGGDAVDVAIQPDGKIVVAGGAAFALARYQPDGDLDADFGNGGTTPFGSLDAWAYAVAIQADGKIVVVGWAGSSFALARYDSDGILDASFGTGGIVTTTIGSNSGAYGVAIQTDGRIVVVGATVSAFALARYDTNGSLDSTFGTGGTVTTTFSDSAGAVAVAIQSDGKIVAGGYSISGPILVFALARYDLDGSLDAGFGVGGKVTTAIGPSADHAEGLAIQADGKIVAAGSSTHDRTNSVSSVALARYRADGSLDPTFGSGGKLTTPGFRYATGLALQPDGKLLVAATSSGDSFALLRYWP